MLLRVAVDFTGRRLEDLRLYPLRQTEQVDTTVYARLDRMNWIELVVLRRSWASEIVDLIYVQIEWRRNIVGNQVEMRMPQQMSDIFFTASMEVVDTYYMLAGFQKSIAKVGAEKTGTTGDQNFARVHRHHNRIP